MTSINKSYKTSKVEVEVITYIFDVNTWLAPFLPVMQNHIYAHAFKFVKNEKKESVMFYKKRESHKSWLPEKNALVIITRKPQEKPKLLRPDFKKQKRVTDLRNLLQKCMVRMDADEMETWEKFVTEWERIIDI